jgi:hypothetical protein
VHTVGAARRQIPVGFFDVFLNEEGRIQKNQRTLVSRDVQGEDRDAAAAWLGQNGTPRALVALLTRFDMNLENQLKDKKEKEAVYSLVQQAGEAAIRPLERHLERCRQVAVPLKLYVEMKGELAATEKVMSILEVERAKDDFKPQKKVDLLVWLVDRRHPHAIDAVTPLLEDFDENVRYAAMEVIAAQQDDAGRIPLERVLQNAAEESNRLRVRVAELFVQRRWPLANVAAVEAAMPAGYLVVDGRLAPAER